MSVLLALLYPIVVDSTLKPEGNGSLARTAL